MLFWLQSWDTAITDTLLFKWMDHVTSSPIRLCGGFNVSIWPIRKKSGINISYYIYIYIYLLCFHKDLLQSSVMQTHYSQLSSPALDMKAVISRIIKQRVAQIAMSSLICCFFFSAHIESIPASDSCRINPADFPLTSPPQASHVKLTCLVQNEMSRQLLDGLSWNLLQSFIFPTLHPPKVKGYNSCDLLTFPLASLSG